MKTPSRKLSGPNLASVNFTLNALWRGVQPDGFLVSTRSQNYPPRRSYHMGGHAVGRRLLEWLRLCTSHTTHPNKYMYK